MNTPNMETPRSPRRTATLWTTAALMTGVLGWLLAPSGWFAPEPVNAALVSQSGSYTIMTTDSTNEDLVLVLDGRSEQLLVFRTERLNELQLMQKLSLPQMFGDARAKSGRK
ncbi:MAG: hypothetical protein HUU18_11770 [Phycisphaerales bacterium]|jgi:hypothetical protein|nr:hypothetical protein [Phycisphaerales bacterium]